MPYHGWWSFKEALNSSMRNAAWRLGFTNESIDILNGIVPVGMAAQEINDEKRKIDQAMGDSSVISSKKRSQDDGP